MPEAALDALPDDERYIFPAPVPRGPASKAAPAGPRGRAEPRFSHRLPAEEPIRAPGGTVRIVDSANFPVASTIAAALVEVEPGALRELHWHPNAVSGSTTCRAWGA